MQQSVPKVEVLFFQFHIEFVILDCWVGTGERHSDEAIIQHATKKKAKKVEKEKLKKK